VRTISFSIRKKILLLFGILVLGSIAIYIWSAIKMFREDKTAYIFENNLQQVERLKVASENFLKKVTRDTVLLINFHQANQETFFKQNLDNLDYFKQVFVIKEGAVTLKFKGALLGDQEILNNFANDFKNGFSFKPIKINNVGLVIFYFQDPSLSEIWGGIISLETIQKFLSKNKDQQDFILTSDKNPLAQDITSDSPLLIAVSQTQVAQGAAQTNEINIGGKDFLIATTKSSEFALTFFSLTSKEAAFRVANHLTKKSMIFGIFIISGTLIAGIIFSNTLTGPIKKLFQATQLVSKGDFNIQFDIKTHDEIGALSDSFQLMSKKILEYVEESKEKVRMEKELEVARTVQQSFFPRNSFQYPKVELSAFYKSASECGGDWWGHIKIGDHVILGIGDATGHGVPAALLTATINSAFHLIERMVQFSPSLIERPDEMMKILNETVVKMGGQIHMTFFLGIVDLQKSELHYTNASHNFPLVVDSSKISNDSGEDWLDVLDEANGARLGHQKDAQYTKAMAMLTSGQILVMLTDGLIEGENSEGRQWGERRLKKALQEKISPKVDDVLNGIVENAFTFYNNEALKDDVTLLLTRLS
jgi:sigma-B regulation protein RsbU (phosphoserine phosphatase)